MSLRKKLCAVGPEKAVGPVKPDAWIPEKADKKNPRGGTAKTIKERIRTGDRARPWS